MSDYKDINNRISNLKLAAIDAKMADLQFHLKADHSVYCQGDLPDDASSGGDPYSYRLDVERPKWDDGAGDYVGGGAISGIFPADSSGTLPDLYKNSDQYVKLFDQVRKDIDDRVNRWKGLPDPAKISESIKGYMDGVVMKISTGKSEVSMQDPDVLAAGQLANGSSSTYKSSTGDEGMSYYIREIEYNSSADDLKGDTMRAFKSRFINKMPVIVDNLCFASRINLSALYAELDFIVATRTSVMDAIEQAASAFVSIRDAKKGSFKTELDILSWGLDALSIAGTAASGSSVLIPLSKLAVSVTKTVTSQNDDVSKYEDVLSSFDKALDEINSQLQKGEKGLWDALGSSMSEMRKDKDKPLETAELHLPGYILTDTKGTDMEVSVDSDVVEVLTGNMAHVANILEHAYGNLTSNSYGVHDALKRKSTIGYTGTFGIANRYTEFQLLLYELMVDLEWQIEEGAVNLRLASADLYAQDEESQAKLDRLTEEANRGSGVNPWNGGSIEYAEKDPSKRPLGNPEYQS